MKKREHIQMNHQRLWWTIGVMLFCLPVHAGGQNSLEGGAKALQKQDFPTAIATFSRILDRTTSTPTQRVEAFSGRCAAYYQQQLGSPNPRQENRAQKAISDCSRAVTLQADHASSYRLRGMTYLTIEQPALALADLNVAIALDPKDYLALKSRGAARTRLNQFEAARADLDAAIRINPDHPGSYYYRCQLQAEQNRHEQAEADFNTFFQLVKRHESASPSVAQGNPLMGQGLLSRKDVEQAMRRNPLHPAPHAPPEADAVPPEPDPVAQTTEEPASAEVRDALSAVIVDAALEADLGPDGKRVNTPHVKGKFAFKVESFRESANADKALAKVTDLNLPVYVETVDINQITHIRVWVGPFNTGAAAEAARRKMTAGGYHPDPVNRF